MKNFPTLYQKNQLGALQQWSISAGAVDPDGAMLRRDGVSGPAYEKMVATQDDLPNVDSLQGKIVITWGQAGGALQTTVDIIRVGKNKGRANCTTAVEQAEKEAEAKWVKQKKKGYVESIEQAQAGEVDAAVILGGVEPMLAPNKSYPKDPDLLKRIVFPCYYQPKLDGIRATGDVRRVYSVDDEYVETSSALWSRTRKPIRSVPHIVKTLKRRFLSGCRPDGELYSHEYRKTFEDLIGILTQDEPDADGLYLRAEYHMYDLIEGMSMRADAPFSERIETLYSTMFGLPPKWTDGTVPGTQVLEHPTNVPGPLFFVKTTRCHNMEQLLACFELDLEAEYEGGMAKNAAGVYTQGKRSPNVQKMKMFEDHEFTVTAVNDGRGKDAGTAATFSVALPCVCCGKGTPGGEDSRARIKRPYAKRREYLAQAADLVGKTLTVTLKRWTAYGKPYLPVAKAFREE